MLGQQAVSRTIAALERELGVSLLELTSHSVRLTPAGEELLAFGREILAAADAAFLWTRAAGSGRIARPRSSSCPPGTGSPTAAARSCPTSTASD